MPHTLDPADRAEALAGLTPAELERYSASPADAFLAGRLLLRRLTAELTGEAAELTAECPDCGGAHGKPGIPGSKLQLSLSHGAGVVVAAAVFGARVGVDHDSAAPEALAAIGALTGEATLQRWTRVEAILKADGRGLRVDPSQVLIDGDVGRVAESPTRYALEERELAPGLRVSLARELID